MIQINIDLLKGLNTPLLWVIGIYILLTLWCILGLMSYKKIDNTLRLCWLLLLLFLPLFGLIFYGIVGPDEDK